MRKLQSKVVTLIVAMTVTGMIAGGAVGSVVGQEDDPESAPANFEITNVETNAPVTAGEKLEVEVTVENTGGEAAEEDVAFYLDDADDEKPPYLKHDAEVRLDPGATETVPLSYVTKSENAGEWTLIVETPTETPDDTWERTITIEEPPSEGDSDAGDGNSGTDGTDATTGSASGQHPNYEVVDVAVDGNITAGETLRTNVTVENTGDDLGEKLVWITLDGETVERAIVELRAGEQKTVTLTYNTSFEEAGSRTFSANTSDDVTREPIEIAEAESDYRIRNVEAAGPVPAGEVLTVTVDVENVGDRAERSPVRLAVDGYFIDEEPVELAPNESTSVELQYRTNEEFAGQLDLNVSTNNSHDARAVTVEEPTPTPTETETTSTSDSASSAAAESAESTVDETPAGEGASQQSMPGFGAAVAIAALLASAVAATRRG